MDWSLFLGSKGIQERTEEILILKIESIYGREKKILERVWGCLDVIGTPGLL